MPAVFLSQRLHPLIPQAALVTGGAKRLGRAAALALADAGFAVAVHCNGSVAEAEATAAEVRGGGVAGEFGG